MANLFSALIALCLLRRGPQDLPYSPPLTRLLVVLLVATNLFYTAFIELPDALPRLLLALAWLLGAPWLLLRLSGRRERYAQTLMAFAGSGLVFALAFLPLAVAAADLPALAADTPPTSAQLTIAWLTLLAVGWKLAVASHILRHALDWPRLASMALALALLMLEMGVDHLLFASAGA